MIKSFKVQQIYQDTASIQSTISALDFKENFLGEELPDFQMLGEPLKLLLNSFAPALEVDEHSGFFRKPYNPIHVDECPKGRIYVGIAAISPTMIKFHKHIETGATGAYQVEKPIYEIIDEAILQDKFEIEDVVKLNIGEIFFFHPWMLHSIESELIQIFYIRQKLQL